MNVADFDFELPPERVAQTPLAERDASRLMLLERGTGAFRHHLFREFPGLLRRGDLLVLNDTQVIPARLIGKKPTGGRVELLLLEPAEAQAGCAWRCLAAASKPLRPGTRLEFDGALGAEVVVQDGLAWIVRFDADESGLQHALARYGRVPLPPYIRRDHERDTQAEDRARYQTVYARSAGAVAAPTAGLHFTQPVLDAVARCGVEVATLTLHTGAGTFLPVRTDVVEDHRLDPERFELPPAAAEAVARARERGGRVVAVGTTVARTLEANSTGSGRVRAGSGRTGLFLYPGHRFEVVDALLTNFHLPRSTLLMLVSAFAGRENVLAAYRAAVHAEYRFYSYGDAMLIA